MEIWEGLMYVLLAVLTAIQPAVVDGVVQRSVDALWGFVSGELGRLWRLAQQKMRRAQKIEEELKTQIKGAEAENEMLKKNNREMEKQVVGFQKIEEDLKTKVKEVEVDNKMLSNRNEIMEKKVGDLQNIEEELKREIKELKTEIKELKKEIKEVEAKNEVLRKTNEVMEKKVVDLHKIEEQLKTEKNCITEAATKNEVQLKNYIDDVVANNDVLRKSNEVADKKVADLQKIEEELKTKIKVMGAENNVLREKTEAIERMVESKIIGEGGISSGPWGGEWGTYWAYKSDVAPIMQINLKYGTIIDSILIKSKSCDGNVIASSQRIGGSGGHNTVMVQIDSSIERLSSISLTWASFNGEVTITSLCFYSNRDSYGPFGTVCGPPVSIPVDDHVVLAGFHGRAGTYLNAFGIFVAPKVLNS